MNHNVLGLVRVFHNLNRTQVAKRVGLSLSYVSELEAGSKKMTLEVLEKYAEGFKMPLSSLILFSEMSRENRVEETTRIAITGKVVKMLNWLAAIGGDESSGKEIEASSEALSPERKLSL